MQAMTQVRYGTTSVMAVREVPKPKIGANEVLVRVRAAGVIARPVYGVRKPKKAIRGTDVAGHVEAVGANVTRFRAGDEVFGWADGSFAEYASVAEGSLAAKPANISFEQAASVPMAALVALQAVRDHGKVVPGRRVLVNGASGGIGTFAVQIAKAFGADVTAVVSTRNTELMRSIGADHVIDYTKDDFTRNGQRYDMILDNVSNHSLSALRRALAGAGVLIANGGNFGNRWFASVGRLIRGAILFRFGGQKFSNFLVSMNADDLVVLKEMIEAGDVTPVIDRSYPLAEARQAMDHVGAGHSRGKVAITVAA
jgi:NADPH:quinone reductase-like Zn-dependent oxidoreductase